MSNDNGSDQGEGAGGGQQWSDSRYILKEEQTGFAEGLKVGVRLWALQNERTELLLTEIRRTEKE